MEWIDILIGIVYLIQVVVSYMWVRSGYYIFRIYKEISNYEITVLVLPIIFGGSLSIYNLSDIDYLLLRFPATAFLNITCAWAIYVFAKTKKEKLWNISNVLKREYSENEKNTLKKIDASSDEVEIVAAKNLDVLEFFKPYPSGNKCEIIRIQPPRFIGVAIGYKFNAEMIKGGEFGKQRHPDLREEIYVIRGRVLETYSQKEYQQGDIIEIPKNKVHGLKALERTSVTAYLFKD